MTGRPKLPALAAGLAGLLALALGLAGCEEEEASIAVTRGPAPPDGDLIQSSATVLPDQTWSNLATTSTQSQGSGEALIVGLVLLKSGGAPDFRLTINGTEARDAQTQLFHGPSGTLAAVFCACELQVGESDIALEASGNARVGARSIDAFTAAALEKVPSSKAVGSATINDQEVDVTPNGATLASTTLPGDTDKLIVIGNFRANEESSASPDVIRAVGLVDGKEMEQVATSTLPGGKIVVFLAPHGGRAGSKIELRGFVTAGHAPVSVTTLATCACDLEQ